MAFDAVYGLLGRQNNASSEPVTVDRAIAIPTVWRCVGLLATVIAGCPLLIYKDPNRKLIRVRALDPANFDTTYTPFELWELTVSHIALWGNAYIKKIRNDADEIVDLIPINPNLVKTKPDKNGKKTFEVRRLNPDGTLAKTETFDSFTIMHIPGLGYDGMVGLSPLQVAAQTYGTALAADKLAARFFSQGSQLSGILKVKAPLAEQAQADEIKRRWMATNAGVAHGGTIAVLDAETDFMPLTIPPDSLQFLESRQWEAAEIGRMFGIPPHLLNETDKSTSWGTGIEQLTRGFINYTIGGWTERIAQRVTREVVNTRGQRAEFDLTELMRGSMTERFAAYAQAIQWGWMTRAEARAKEDMPPIHGLEKPLTPLNMTPGINPAPQDNANED